MKAVQNQYLNTVVSLQESAVRWECRRGGGGAASAGGWGWWVSSVRTSKRDLPMMMIYKEPAAIGVLRKGNTVQNIILD